MELDVGLNFSTAGDSSPMTALSIALSEQQQSDNTLVGRGSAFEI